MTQIHNQTSAKGGLSLDMGRPNLTESLVVIDRAMRERDSIRASIRRCVTWEMGKRAQYDTD